MPKRKTTPRRKSQKPPTQVSRKCTPAPRLVVVGTSILEIQSRLTKIDRRQSVLDAEFDSLDEEKNQKLSDLSLLQREMDKLTAAHHVVEQ